MEEAYQKDFEKCRQIKPTQLPLPVILLAF